MVSLRFVAARCALCDLRLLHVQEHSYLDTDSEDISYCDGEKLLCGLGTSALTSSDYSLDCTLVLQHALSIQYMRYCITKARKLDETSDLQ